MHPPRNLAQRRSSSRRAAGGRFRQLKNVKDGDGTRRGPRASRHGYLRGPRRERDGVRPARELAPGRRLEVPQHLRLRVERSTARAREAVLGDPLERRNGTVLNWNVVVKTLTGTGAERFLHDGVG